MNPGSASVPPARRARMQEPAAETAALPGNRWRFKGFNARRLVSENSHPGPMTRSLPLTRPSRASAFSGFLSPLPKRLKSLGERGTLYRGVGNSIAAGAIQRSRTRWLFDRTGETPVPLLRQHPGGRWLVGVCGRWWIGVRGRGFCRRQFRGRKSCRWPRLFP